MSVLSEHTRLETAVALTAHLVQREIDGLRNQVRILQASIQERDDYEAFGACESCGRALGIEGGMAGTGLCGVCATGSADADSERGETW